MRKCSFTTTLSSRAIAKDLSLVDQRIGRLFRSLNMTRFAIAWSTLPFCHVERNRDIPLCNLSANATGLFLSCAQNGGDARNKGGSAIERPQPKTPREVGG